MRDERIMLIKLIIDDVMCFDMKCWKLEVEIEYEKQLDDNPGTG
jgi:hypothetical protein